MTKQDPIRPLLRIFEPPQDIVLCARCAGPAGYGAEKGGTGEVLEELAGDTRHSSRQVVNDDPPTPSKDDKFWYDDGTLVLIAANIDFRVYRRALAKHSPVFPEMLALPQPPLSQSTPPTPGGSDACTACPTVPVFVRCRGDVRDALRMFRPLSSRLAQGLPPPPPDLSFHLSCHAHEEYKTMLRVVGCRDVPPEELTEVVREGMDALDLTGEKVWVRPAFDGLQVLISEQGEVRDNGYDEHPGGD